MKENEGREVEVFTFKVYPEMKRLHFQVYVWNNRRDMRAYLKGGYPGKGLNKVLACVTWPDSGEKSKNGCIGEIHFNRQDLSTEIVAHESTHAAIRWARYIGLNIVEDVTSLVAPDTEERFCYALGAIVEQIEVTLSDNEYK